jgi:F0F1-type ATP synthase membrane subunit b/b'
MNEIHAQSPQQVALQRLLQVDADSVLLRQQALQEAADILSAADQAAQQLLTAMRTAAEAEAAERRSHAQREFEAEAAELDRLAALDREERRRRALDHTSAAILLLTAWVKAEG